jgi:uridine phosphorylase
MAFPNLEGKHVGRPYITAQRVVDYENAQGNPQANAPRTIVLTWDVRLENAVRERREYEELQHARPGWALLQLSPDLGLALLPVGAPATAMAIEELSARGTELFVGIGTAGAISDQLAPGGLVVCSAALRDEGTSHHYAPSETFAHPDPALTARLRKELPDAAHGPSWTTDAPYRETAEELAKYRAEGILTVDMEASCLFTVARAVGVPAAAAFVVSDVIEGDRWEPHFSTADILPPLWSLFEAAATAGASTLTPSCCCGSRGSSSRRTTRSPTTRRF